MDHSSSKPKKTPSSNKQDAEKEKPALPAPSSKSTKRKTKTTVKGSGDNAKQHAPTGQQKTPAASAAKRAPTQQKTPAVPAVKRAPTQQKTPVVPASSHLSKPPQHAQPQPAPRAGFFAAATHTNASHSVFSDIGKNQYNLKDLFTVNVGKASDFSLFGKRDKTKTQPEKAIAQTQQSADYNAATSGIMQLTVTEQENVYSAGRLDGEEYNDEDDDDEDNDDEDNDDEDNDDEDNDEEDNNDDEDNDDEDDNGSEGNNESEEGGDGVDNDSEGGEDINDGESHENDEGDGDQDEDEDGSDDQNPGGYPYRTTHTR